MRCVGLLRGIIVGGANKISMADLKDAFEDAGMLDVRTYINSGNVLFSTDLEDRRRLIMLLQDAVLKRTGASVEVQLRNHEEVAALVRAMPAEWTNDASMKCDVVFLQPTWTVTAYSRSWTRGPGSRTRSTSRGCHLASRSRGCDSMSHA